MNISDRVVHDTTIKDTQQNSNSEELQKQVASVQSEKTVAENTIQDDSSDQGQPLENITDEMRQNVDNTQSSEVLPQTGIKDNSNSSTGYVIFSSSLLLFAISLKFMMDSLKKII